MTADRLAEIRASVKLGAISGKPRLLVDGREAAQAISDLLALLDEANARAEKAEGFRVECERQFQQAVSAQGNAEAQVRTLTDAGDAMADLMEHLALDRSVRTSDLRAVVVAWREVHAALAAVAATPKDET